MTVADAAAEHEAAVPELAHFAHQRECALTGGMAAGAAADADQAVGSRLYGLARVLGIDHVAEHDPAVAVHRFGRAARVAETGDDQRHPVRHDDLQIGLVTGVGPVHDQIDRVWPYRRRRVRRLVVTQIGFDFGQPLVELRGRPGVDVRKSADHARHALRRHQRREGNKKHRRADHGHGKSVFQQGRQGHFESRAWLPADMDNRQFLQAPMALNISGTASAASRVGRSERAAAAISLIDWSSVSGGSAASSGCPSRKPV